MTIRPRQSPPRSTVSHKPLFLWFLGHELDHAELRRQVTEFKAKGWGGFIMHWISGGEPYMGARWLDGLQVIIECAALHGLEAWLYDEAWCPSGFAGGRLLARRPELAGRTIRHEVRDVADGEELCLDFELRHVLSAVALPLRNGTPQPEASVDLEEELGPVEVDQQRPYRHDWGYYPHARPLLHWRQAAQRRVWRLRWRALRGAWRVYVFWAREVTAPDDRVTRPDMLHPETVGEFIAETLSVYEERFGPYFGNVIPGIMTDEAKFCRMPWTPALPLLYAERSGHAFAASLPAIVDASIPESAACRVHYHKLAADLFRQNFMRPLGRWCDEHGLLLTGHISPEEDPSSESTLTGSIAHLLESFHVPGTDLIIQAVGDAERPALNLGPRLASSVARQRGRARVFVEVGACCDEDMSLEQLKHLCDWLMVNGVNLIAVHGLNYSNDGFRKFYAGQTYSYQTNLWLNIQELTEYLARRSTALTAARPHRTTAVLKSLTNLRAQFQPGDEAPDETADDALIDLVWAFLQSHCDIDLLDDDTAQEWQVDGDQLRYGEAAYRVLAIPECDWISEAAASQLKQWVAAGGTVICVGRAPSICAAVKPVTWSAGVSVTGDAREAVALAIDREPPPLRVEGARAEHVLVSHLRSADNEASTLLLNLLPEEQNITVTRDGHATAVRLAPMESRLLPEDDSRTNTDADPAPPTHRLEIPGPWDLTAHAENHVPLVESHTEVTVEPGASIRCIVLDEEERDTVLSSLTLDGERPKLRPLGRQHFYDCMNHVYEFEEPPAPGEHVFELETTSCPTVLLAGRFGAFGSRNHWRLEPERAQADTVDRVAAGYPFLRGQLSFSTRLALSKALPPETRLHLPGRRGCVTVAIDDVERGTVAWPPDIVRIGSMPRGDRRITLSLVGDGIGILRLDAYPAGLTGSPFLAWA